MRKLEWERLIPGDPNFTTDVVMMLLDFHCGSDSMHSIDWFPDQQYRVTSNRNYLVDTSITNEILVPWDPDDQMILARACFLASPWRVTDANWLAFDWGNRIVYVPDFRAGEKSNVYRRVSVLFDKMPKPTWRDFTHWEEDYQIELFVGNDSTDFIDKILRESQAELLAGGQLFEHLETARGILYDRIMALDAPILDATEDRAVRAQALNVVYDALKPAALDAAMLVEVNRIRAKP